MVLPDQKVAFMINRIVASCKAIKKGITYKNIVPNSKDSHYLQKSSGYQSVSTILHTWVVGVASSLSCNSFLEMQICRSLLFMRILHPASISKSLGPAQQNIAGSHYINGH